VDTNLDGHRCSSPSALGNDGVYGAAAIADHKSVLDGPGRTEIDLLEAGAVRIDLIAAGFAGSKVGHGWSYRKPVSRVIDL